MKKKICPLILQIHMNMKDSECIEEDCSWWNETYKACGMRLAAKREGQI